MDATQAAPRSCQGKGEREDGVSGVTGGVWHVGRVGWAWACPPKRSCFCLSPFTLAFCFALALSPCYSGERVAARTLPLPCTRPATSSCTPLAPWARGMQQMGAGCPRKRSRPRGPNKPAERDPITVTGLLPFQTSWRKNADQMVRAVRSNECILCMICVQHVQGGWLGFRHNGMRQGQER